MQTCLSQSFTLSKMKRLFFLCAFGAIVTVGASLKHLGVHLKEKVSDQEFHDFIHKQSHNSSMKNCPKFEARIKDASHSMEECIHQKFNPDVENICHFIDHNFQTCTKPPRDLLVQCLSKKYKDVPDLIFSMFTSLANFICKAKGSELLELTQPCITHTLSDTDGNVCSEEVDMKLLEFSVDFPTKTQLCEFAKSLRKCIKNLLEENCSSSITKRNFLKFYDAFIEPCKN